MEFVELTKIFNKLETTSKRISKILLLRDFLENNPKEGPVIFDIIAGNFQRELDKKKLAISIKTIFEVLGFVSRKNKSEIEKEFNKIGDIGEVAQKVLEEKRQKSLNLEILTVKEIKKSLVEISKITGTNSNKKKKEKLTNLFLLTRDSFERKYLARLLIDDLRIGVSEGVLKESMTNTYFPKIIDIHKMCPDCNYFNLNLVKCMKCGTEIKKTDQLSILENKYEVINLTTPKNIKGLSQYIDYEINPIEFALRRDKNKYIIASENPRKIYNEFLLAFEKKYNLVNSFVELSLELNKDFTNINKFEIKIGRPIRSMLAPRVKTVKEGFEMTNTPSLIDFKYDGLRVQIHNNEGEVKLFTRNLDEITQQFPEVIEYVKKNFSDLSFVLDTECVGFDYINKKFLPFQTLSKRILTKEIEEVRHINVIVKAFDILYLNGTTLIDVEYVKRREKLKKIMINRKMKQRLNFDVNKLKDFSLN